MAEDRLLSPLDLAEQLGIPVGTIYQWNHRGGGPPFLKVGKHVRYRQSDVDAWLDESRRAIAPAS